MLQLKQTSKARLEQLQNAMVQAEDEYNLVIEEEAKEREEQMGQKQSHHKGGGKPTAIRDYINNLFVDISHAADDLQKKMKDDTFEHEIHSKDHKMAINTVVKVGGQEAEGMLTSPIPYADRGGSIWRRKKKRKKKKKRLREKKKTKLNRI